MVFSLACLAASALIVGAYDNKPLADFHSGSGITLNTIIAILSTAARSALVYVVSATIGQLKWQWFSKSERQLRDMQTLDEASRGPFGSIAMLFSSTRNSIAMLAGVATVMTVAFGPFFQQILEYPTRSVEASTGEAKIANNLNYTSAPALSGYAPWNDDLPTYDSRAYAFDRDFNNVMKSGLYSDSKSFNLRPTCPTSQCSWDSFISVGWCSQCEDVTATATLKDCQVDEYLQAAAVAFESSNSSVLSDDDINEYARISEVKLPSCTVDLGKGDTVRLLRSPLQKKTISLLGLDIASEAIWPVNFGNKQPQPSFDFEHKSLYSNNISYMGVPNPLAVFGYVSLRVEDARWPIKISIKAARRCFLTLCEKEYAVRVENGITQANVVSTKYGDLFIHDDDDPGTTSLTCWKPEEGPVTLSKPHESEEVYVDPKSRTSCPVDGYAMYIARNLRSNATTQIVMGRHEASEAFTLGKIIPATYSYFDIIGPGATKDLETLMEGIAASLTSWGLSKSTSSIVGHSFANETYVHVRWLWLIPPACLELAILALFLTAVMQSRRARLPIWKSSALALLYHNRPDVSDKPLERLSQMDRAAGTTVVQLYMDARDGHVLRLITERAMNDDHRSFLRDFLSGCIRARRVVFPVQGNFDAEGFGREGR